MQRGIHTACRTWKDEDIKRDFWCSQGKSSWGSGTFTFFWVFLSIDGFPFNFLICPSFGRSRNEMNVFMVSALVARCYFHCCCHADVNCCNASVLRYETRELIDALQVSLPPIMSPSAIHTHGQLVTQIPEDQSTVSRSINKKCEGNDEQGRTINNRKNARRWFQDHIRIE